MYPAAVASESKKKKERTRSIVVAALAMLGLTAILTLLSETVWQRPAAPVPSSTKAGGGASAAGSSSGARIVVPQPADTAVTTVAVSFDGIEVDGIKVAR